MLFCFLSNHITVEQHNFPCGRIALAMLRPKCMPLRRFYQYYQAVFRRWVHTYTRSHSHRVCRCEWCALIRISKRDNTTNLPLKIENNKRTKSPTSSHSALNCSTMMNITIHRTSILYVCISLTQTHALIWFERLLGIHPFILTAYGSTRSIFHIGASVRPNTNDQTNERKKQQERQQQHHMYAQTLRHHHVSSILSVCAVHSNVLIHIIVCMRSK